MKVVRLTVVRSTERPELVSLRSQDGHTPRRELTAAGFAEGDEVVVVDRAAFDLMRALYETRGFPS